MDIFGSIPQPWRYVLVVVICFLVSVAGVVWGVHTGSPSAGQRGGAIATGLAFVMLFSRPDYGLLMYRAGKEDPAPLGQSKIDALEVKMAAFEQALEINSGGVAVQNFGIAAAGAIGAIFWGFGDIFVCWFK